MTALLKAESGPASGHEVVINPGEQVRVGRTRAADFVVTGDPRISGIHFAAYLDANGTLRVRDLGSTNGLYKNGLSVVESEIGSEDRLQAGTTIFVVQFMRSEPSGDPDPVGPSNSFWDESSAPPNGPLAVEPVFAGVPTSSPRESDDESQFFWDSSVPPSRGRTYAEPSIPKVPLRPKTAVALELPVAPQYVRETCPSGVCAYRGIGNEPGPVGVARQLAKMRPLFLVIDFVKLNVPAPRAIDESSLVFDWLPLAWRADFSPVLLGPTDPIPPFEWIERAWSKNAMTCFFTNMSHAALLERLRAASREAHGDDPTPHAGMIGCCWPETLARYMRAGESDQVLSFTSEISAVLVEAEAPTPWQVFSGTGFGKALEIIGFVDALERKDVGNQ